ncbi:hemerythrin domain-containing protein [Mesorhizobium sp. M7A.F.Ce.TU.012.03.2.1]|uniref:hemerythrin domain-containing protein n=1 Tax=Mesorhizobium sp. M7A.F.Ce.TU.012.03.2.1 TaxID=2493681 RepID=UPI0032AEAA9E
MTPIQQSAHRRLDPCQSHILLDWAALVAQTIRRLSLNRLKELGSLLNETGRENTAARSGREAVTAAVMKRAHLEKLQLCAALEKIADTLPRVDPLACLTLANAIVPLLRDSHEYEESVIFPAYETALANNRDSARRLRAEHVEDECFAAEVTEILLAIGHGKTIDNAEAVGFMLRGFFESLRRHIAFEREHVLPMIGSDY